MPSAIASHRMQIVPEEVSANFRASTYAMVNCFVNQQRLWMKTLKMDPEPMPQQMVGTISRRAVAAASGMPRETARRIIIELLESGRLIKSGHNAVRVVPDTARVEGFPDVPALLLVDIVRMTDELQRVGVLVDRAADA